MEQRLNMGGGGILSWRQEGGRVLLRAERPADGKGLYKVWLRRNGQDCFLLGTLAPEGNGLRLFRSVARGELERAGCWPIEEAQARLVFRFQTGEGWYREGNPGSMVRDPVLRGKLTGPMLCKKNAQGFCLALSFRTDAPAPLTELVCLACVERVEGRPHWIWYFDREGRPIPAHKDGCDGHTEDRTGG